MNFLRILFVVALLGLIAACTSTGVTPMGRDTYMIARKGTAVSSGSGLKAALLREANEWCTKQGLVMVVVSTKALDGIPGVQFANAELVFRAVKAGDVEDVRTNLEKAPDRVIEVRDR